MNQYEDAIKAHTKEILDRAKKIRAILQENTTGEYEDEFVIIGPGVDIVIKVNE